MRRLHHQSPLPAGRGAGSGKTTLAFQFLLEGVRRGERVLYITLSETEEEIRAVALTHGWPFDGIEVRELVPTQDSLGRMSSTRCSTRRKSS